MMNGTNQLAVINQHIATARNGLDAVYRRMEAANQEISQLRNRLVEEYRELARFRLNAVRRRCASWTAPSSSRPNGRNS